MRALPVAASTGLLFSSGALRSGSLDRDAWRRRLDVLKSHGFEYVDISELWLPLADLTAGEMDDLAEVIDASGLTTVGVSIIDVDLLSDSRREASRKKVLRAIELTERLRASYLSIGFHALPTAPPSRRTPDPYDGVYQTLGGALADLAEHAGSRGIEISLEMYEAGILDCSERLLAIIEAAGSRSIGANPDLGNLLRAPWPLSESWQETVERLAPHINYWHVKNLIRIPMPDGNAASHPADLRNGSIDYRTALSVAVRSGFRGPLVIEHYGGDAIAIAAAGRDYLQDLVQEVIAFEGASVGANGLRS